MADPEGTDGEGTGCNGWFFVETIVEKKTGDVISDDEDETATDTGSDMVDFIDTQLSICEQAEQETAQALFHAQEVQNDAQVLHLLKRKFAGGSKENSPLGEQLSVETDLSPRLQEISLNSGHKKAKRRLFTISDSGYGCSEVEAAETQVTVNTNAENGGSVHSTQSSGGDSSDNAENVDPQCSITELKELLQASNKKVAMLAVFKDIYGLSFTDLVRNFKSDKTHVQIG